MPTEGDPSRHDDDQNDDQLNHAKEVLETKTPFQSHGVDEKGSSQTRKSNSTLIPASDFDLGCVENILSKDNTVTSSPSKQDDICREHGSDEEFRFLVDIFKVVLLASVSARISLRFLGFLVDVTRTLGSRFPIPCTQLFRPVR